MAAQTAVQMVLGTALRIELRTVLGGGAADRLGGDRDHLACRVLHAAGLAPQSTEQAFTNPLTLPQDRNGPAPTFPA
jgi:hypothetical protein